jgi:hypothetical protein
VFEGEKLVLDFPAKIAIPIELKRRETRDKAGRS